MKKLVTAQQAALGMIAAALIVAPGFALGQEATTLKGMITSHNGSTIVVRGADGDKSVALTDTTKIRGTSGVLGVRGEDHPATDLIRGLAVEVTATATHHGSDATHAGSDAAHAGSDTAHAGSDTAHAGSQLTATEVTFKNSDLKTARAIGAGLHTTDENVAKNVKGIAENSERIDNVGLLVPAGRTKIFFPVGSAAISDKGKQDLDDIAAQAKGIKGAYRLAVVGRADKSGNAAANEKLSAQRAVAVRQYLIRSAGISPANFIPTTALGSAPVAEDTDPPGTPQEARRVTVTIAVNKSNQHEPK
ncbi:MAG TPA: OmpA family protein [Phenylobacterium sp.]|jgi:outer membrane protein OmpA-like peptidoglycan-associated protein